jgi:serine/threonine protein kinase
MSAEPELQSSAEQQLRRACGELARGIREGRPCRAEDFLSCLALTGDEPEPALELIYAEFVARSETGERVQAEELMARFPQWQEPIERLLAVHNLMLGSGGDGSEETSVDLFATPASNFNVLSLPPCSGFAGRYELGERIGTGGMGVVYKARQQGLNRLVAIKVVRSGPLATEDDLRRFRAEAEAVARLRHANIVQVYEVGEHEGWPFLCLEYVEGGSLATRLAGGVLPPQTAARLVQTLATAAHYAHQQGIVHRDLKPANILLDPAGGQAADRAAAPNEEARAAWIASAVPKISDFGLVHRLDGDGQRTREGAMIGTPAYMPPEQADPSVRVGPECDVYSLGAILYEVVTGRPPFMGESALDTLDQVRSRDPIPPRKLRPALPRDLETICLKCLRKDPKGRYATAAALADDLARFKNEEPIHARRTGPVERTLRWCRRKPLSASLAAALALATVLGVGGVAVQWRRANLQAEAAEQARRAAQVAEADAVRQRNDAIRQSTRANENLHLATDLVSRLTLVATRLGNHSPDARVRQVTFKNALATYDKLIPQTPEDVQLRLGQAMCQVSSARIHEQVQEWNEAAEAYAKAADSYRSLVGLPAAHPYASAELAECQLAHARLLRRLNRLNEAEETCREAVAVGESFAEKDRSNTVCFTHASSLIELCQIEVLQGRADQWPATLARAFERKDETFGPSKEWLGEVPPESVPGSAADRKERGLRAMSIMKTTLFDSSLVLDTTTALEELALCLQQAGDAERASATLLQAVDVRERVPRFFLDPRANQSTLARDYQAVGELELLLGRSGRARRAFLRAAELLDTLTATPPERDTDLARLADVRARLITLPAPGDTP